MSFVHLHTHTGYSLKDGMNKLDALMAKSKEYGFPAIAITDHGQMFGHIPFAKAAKKAGIKAIIGCEMYIDPRGMDLSGYEDKKRDNRHLVLLAKNEIGYKNLSILATKASLEGFYYDPRIDHALLEKYSEGLIALSACLGGDVAREIRNAVSPEMRAYDWSDGFYAGLKRAQWYQSVFGEDFYLEVQDNGIPEQYLLNAQLYRIAEETGIQLVATNDSHYINRSMFKHHDAYMAIGAGKRVTDTDRKKYSTDEFYLKSREDFERSGNLPKAALDNTLAIAEKCKFVLKLGEYKIPKFPDVPPGMTSFEFLRHLGIKGLKERYDEDWEQRVPRLDYELGVIQQMGFNDYFLIVWDFVDYAIRQGYYVGPGRGSGAGSILAYALYITHVDPIEEGLQFERFKRRSLNSVKKGTPLCLNLQSDNPLQSIDGDICVSQTTSTESQ